MYDADFYAEHSPDSRQSAAATVPLIMRLVNPHSVIDIGCGVGTWLAEFAAAGVRDYLGVDGDYVPRDQLHIPADKFWPIDLTRPLNIGRTYDLAISLEVAEHLPADRAEGFIASLTVTAPIVLFSAAIPGQGGTGHVNEQWPDYWRALFRQHGYVAVDAIRPLVWGSTDVMWWYQQNMILYCNTDALASMPDLTAVPDDRSLNVVHPNLFESEPTLGEILPMLARVPRMVAHALRNRVRRRLGYLARRR